MSLRTFRRDPTLWWITGVLSAYSLFVWFLVWITGVGSDLPYAGGEYRGYLEKPNWCLYPLFFPVVALVVTKSWVPFLRAWRDDPPGIALLRTAGGKPARTTMTSLFVREVKTSRAWLVLMAVLASILFNAWDMNAMFKAYMGHEPVQRCEYAVEHPDFFVHWIYANPGAECAHAPSFAVQASDPPLRQWAVMLASNLQQFAIIAMGFMVLFQLLAQIMFFRWPGLTRTGRRFGLRIHLDPAAPARDFGLTRWNRALDGVYYYLSFALLVPILSRMTHQGSPNPGHKIGEVLILALWAAPILFSISTRQKWAYEAEERAMREGREAVLQYKENHIWPLDLPVLGKLWIGFSFALYMVYLTENWNSLLRVLGTLFGAGS